MSNTPPNGDPEVESFIRRHVAALNRADRDAVAADWEDDGTLVDAFPPFIWSGTPPTAQWWQDLEKAITPHGLERVEFKLGEWQRVYVAGDYAYAVTYASALISGATFAVEAKGTWTFVLHRNRHGWKIASWTWGGPPATPTAR